MSNEIKEYDDYFRALADRSYNPATGFVDIAILRAPKWQSPMEAIERAFDHPWINSPSWGNLDRDIFRPYLEHWLAENHIVDLSHVARGYEEWTANIFQARLAGLEVPQNISVGTEAGTMPYLRTHWNPLHLQPDVLTIFVHRQGKEYYKLAISRAPFVPMVPENEKPAGFADFMEGTILNGTPWKVAEGKNWRGKDLVVFRHGTPVYGGAAHSLVFASDPAAKRHIRDQWKPEYQQEIMRVIHENSERAGLPPSMRWVVETSEGSGIFLTRQSTEFPNPLQISGPARSIIRVFQPKKSAGVIVSGQAASSACPIPR